MLTRPRPHDGETPDRPRPDPRSPGAEGTVFDLRRLHPRNWNLRLAWDLFMVWIALVNVSLILFDMTYLLMRPTYRAWVPVVTRVWDPVLGISPHPLTEDLLARATELEELLALDPASPALVARTEGLRRLTERVLREDPFRLSGQDRTLEVMSAVLARESGIGQATVADFDAAVAAFWNPDPDALAHSLDVFDARLRPLLENNYYRDLNLDGKLVDHFWLIDLPFLTLFLVEFAFRWSLAVRRREYARWYFFPMFNWYDVLGLIPYTQFRVFRLFRVVSIYMRLRRSELSRVGKDVLSRGVAYVSNIVAEEISDVVALRILSETQQVIREGTGRRIVNDTVAARRDEIERVLVVQIRGVVANEAIQTKIRELLRLNLENAVENADALRAIPLPNAVLRPLVRATGQIVLDTTLETVVATLDSDEGERVARETAAAVLDVVLDGPWRAQLNALAGQIGIDVIEDMKAAVAVKKWALPDEPSTPQDAPASDGGATGPEREE